MGAEPVGSDPTAPDYSKGAVAGRVRFGYRHMLACSVALDLSVEGGRVASSSTISVDSHSGVLGVAGTSVAFAWGL